ncbi:MULTISPECIES: NAD(P)-dependent alcohol dehydrogenase [Agrobacterium]|uniref:zinc-dependent alcohol dehydrogenase family protein n=1 Tax=Agrobacterium TaxID=357 RepID=UPI000D1EC4B9|nr:MULTISPECIES: NAD(P)-dependent alcohol dehydrogenase [Agrobacterium]MDR6591547.1 NADPH:quinone reductase-like Zn-dependent oxidoreductase [Agrobacterium tumefaciens]UNZ51999.1 NAD(P)-dependent alcohol dehydrogenase [Agrobacterium tumefaciens]
MKAFILRKPGYDHVEQVELPDPGAPARGEIRVRIHASSLNFHDLAVIQGILPVDEGRILMLDGAGIVEAIGEGVSEFAIGDAVVSTFFPDWLSGERSVVSFASTPGDGVDGYARATVVQPAGFFTLAPKGYSHVEAATLPTAGLTAWRAIAVDNPLKPGDTVLVQGTGGVSIFALQFAKHMGATVILTSSSDEKLERARALGADHLINYRSNPDWSAKVLEITEGRGVDKVVETGGPNTLAQSTRSCRVGGHIAVVGALAGFVGDFPLTEVLLRQQKLQGLTVGSRSHHQDMIRAINATGLKPVIDRTFNLDDIVEAFQYQEAGKHFGKICLSI